MPKGNYFAAWVLAHYEPETPEIGRMHDEWVFLDQRRDSDWEQMKILKRELRKARTVERKRKEKEEEKKLKEEDNNI